METKNKFTELAIEASKLSEKFPEGFFFNTSIDRDSIQILGNNSPEKIKFIRNLFPDFHESVSECGFVEFKAYKSGVFYKIVLA